jgi:hypothetical protein
MDQRPLVENQIGDGFKLVKRLVAEGFPVAAAFWVRPSEEEGYWMLYLASKVYDESGPKAAYQKVVDAWLQLDEPWFTMSEITVIREKDPITQDVLAIMRKHPGPMATRSRRPTLGKMDIEEVYIYPPVEEAALRSPPNIKVIGVKRVARGTTTEEVPEEVGYVEGFIGEAEFNTKFAELIRSKFGSFEQFATTYPRIILEEDSSKDESSSAEENTPESEPSK